MSSLQRLLVSFALVLGALLLGACGKAPDLVVYCSLDQEFSEGLMQHFEQESGLRLRVEYDIERAMGGIRASSLPKEFAEYLQTGGAPPRPHGASRA